MPKVIFIAVILLITCSLAGAEIFKCVHADGTVIFTDDPAQAPENCRMEKVTDLPPLGTIPSPPQPQEPMPAADRPDRAPPESNADKLFNDFKAEVVQLVERFQAARHEAAYASLTVDQLKARRELTAIRAQRDTLLTEIEQSLLENAEKRELRERLSPLTP